MNLGELLERHRAIYEGISKEAEGNREESLSVKLPASSAAPRQPAAQESLTDGETDTIREVPLPGPEGLRAVEEVRYPEPSIKRTEPGEDSLARFERVLRWNNRLYTQSMEMEEEA